MIILISGQTKTKKTQLAIFLKKKVNGFVIHLDFLAKQILKDDYWQKKIKVKNFQFFFKNNWSYFLFHCFSFNYLFNQEFTKILAENLQKIITKLSNNIFIIEGVLALKLNLNQKTFKINLMTSKNYKDKKINNLQFLQKITIVNLNYDLKIKNNFFNKWIIFKKINDEIKNW